MALITETFGLFNDDECTSPFTGYFDLEHNTDESDNPQDNTLYFGSLGAGALDTEDRQAQAKSDPGVDNITITPTDILDAWAANTAYVVGDCVEPTTPDGYRYKCTDAGTSHSTTEPVWAGMGGIGSTIIDGGVIWTKVSAKHLVTEITLSLDEAGLDTNIAGAALSLGNTVVSGTDNVVPIWVRVENHVNTVSNNSATPEIALRFNQLYETEVTA